MDEQNEKLTASDILIGNVYQISDDLLNTVYKSVDDVSRFETIFTNIGKRLSSTLNNLECHILKKKWMKGEDRKACIAKAHKMRELIRVCDTYATICKTMVDMTIDQTQRFEKSKSLKGLVEDFVQNLEDEIEYEKDNGIDLNDTDDDID